MIGVVLVAAMFLYTGGRLVRWQAVTLLLIYVGTMPFTISTIADCAEEREAQECLEAAALALPGG